MVIDLAAGAGEPLHRRVRHRLHVRAPPPPGDEARRARAPRARHGDDVQPHRPAHQPRRRQASAHRRRRRALRGPHRPGGAHDGQRPQPDRPQRRRAGRDLHNLPDGRRRSLRRAGLRRALRGDARAVRHDARAAPGPRRRRRRGERGPAARRRGRRAGAAPRHRPAQRRRGAVHRRGRRRASPRASTRRGRPSPPAPPAPSSTPSSPPAGGSPRRARERRAQPALSGRPRPRLGLRATVSRRASSPR